MLEQNGAARLAYSFHDRVDIEPISYVVDGRWVYGRTSVGSKLVTLAHQPWRAMETDRVREPFD